MALPQDGVNMNELPKTSTIPTGKELLFIDPTTNEGGVITLEDLTKQILQNLTSQTFTLDQGTKTLPAALNELNSKALKTINVTGKEYNLDDYDDKSNYYVLYGMDTGTNTGTALPDSKVAKVLSFNGIQLAASYTGKYYIRFKWGIWRPWVEIS